MITVTIRTKQAEHKRTIPQGWSESPWSLGSWLFVNRPDRILALSKIADIPEEWIDESTAEDVIALFKVTKWASTLPGMQKFAYPDFISIAGKEYPLPPDLGELTHRFHVDTDGVARSVNPDNPETITAAYSEVCAAFISEIVRGRYDSKEAERHLKETIPSMKFGTVIAIGSFFLRKKLGLWLSEANAANLFR